MSSTVGSGKERNVLRAWVLAWIPQVPIAVVNAVIRELVYAPHVSELTAHQVSSATFRMARANS